MTNKLKEIKQQLLDHFGKRVEFDETAIKTVSCPYPLTLLGSHINIFGGKSLSFSLDIYSTLLFTPSNQPDIKIYVKEVPGVFKVSLNNIGVPVRGDWLNYIKGSAFILKDKFNINQGFTGVLSYPFPNSINFKSTVIQQLIILALCYVNKIQINATNLQTFCEEMDSEYLKYDHMNLDSITLKHSKSDTLQFVDYDRSKMRLHTNSGSKCKFIVISTGNTLPSYYSDFEQFTKFNTVLNMMTGNKDGQVFNTGNYNEFRSRLPEELLEIGDFYISESVRAEDASAHWKNNNLTDFGKTLSESALSRTTDVNLKNLIEKLNSIDGVYGIQISSNSEIIIFSNVFLVEKIKEQLKAIFKDHDININSGELSNGTVIY